MTMYFKVNLPVARMVRRLATIAAVSVTTTTLAPLPAQAAPRHLDTGDITVTATPQPVYNDNFADPAVAWTGEQFVAVATGGLGPMLTAPAAKGPWTPRGAALTRLPTWSNGGGIWAPEIQHVQGSTWVLFFATKVTGLVDSNQRCIGVAVSTTGPTGEYVPQDGRPLVCPPGSDHPGKSAPVTGGVGFIDPSTFTAKDGRHILLFKSQRPDPGTKLWSVELNDNWTAPVSSSEVLIERAQGQIENPHMVVRSDGYYLFASWDNWANCTYKTVWLKNDLPRFGWNYPSGFPGTTTAGGGTLIKSGNGLCGPGGLVVAMSNGKPIFFLHAYRDGNGNGAPDSDVRRLYAGLLTWNSNAIPKIGYFHTPAG